MSVNALKTLFLLGTLVADCTQCVLNENMVSICTPCKFGLRARGCYVSDIVILGWVLAWSEHVYC